MCLGGGWAQKLSGQKGAKRERETGYVTVKGRVFFFTHICGFLLCHLQLFLGLFQGLGIFVQFIFCTLHLLLYGCQLILQLVGDAQNWGSRDVCGRGAAGNVIDRTKEEVWVQKDRDRPMEKKEREREKKLASSGHSTLVAVSSAVRRLSSDLCNSSSTRSLSSSETRSCFSNCTISSSI